MARPVPSGVLPESRFITVKQAIDQGDWQGLPALLQLTAWKSFHWIWVRLKIKTQRTRIQELLMSSLSATHTMKNVWQSPGQMRQLGGPWRANWCTISRTPSSWKFLCGDYLSENR